MPQVGCGHIQAEDFPQPSEVAGGRAVDQRGTQPSFGIAGKGPRAAQASQCIAESCLPVHQRAVQVEKRNSGHGPEPYLAWLRDPYFRLKSWMTAHQTPVRHVVIYGPSLVRRGSRVSLDLIHNCTGKSPLDLRQVPRALDRGNPARRTPLARKEVA
ncbi:hypothetical protein GCM10010335_64670 [Streptomyces galbus]|nr:hypothetical protein GCM10010335_64670 [Streptomyces galbus]